MLFVDILEDEMKWFPICNQLVHSSPADFGTGDSGLVHSSCGRAAPTANPCSGLGINVSLFLDKHRRVEYHRS